MFTQYHTIIQSGYILFNLRFTGIKQPQHFFILMAACSCHMLLLFIYSAKVGISKSRGRFLLLVYSMFFSTLFWNNCIYNNICFLGTNKYLWYSYSGPAGRYPVCLKYKEQLPCSTIACSYFSLEYSSSISIMMCRS